MCFYLGSVWPSPLPPWAVVTRLQSHPLSHCRLPAWPRERCFKLVLSPLLCPEVLLIFLLLMKFNVHEYWWCGGPPAARALSAQDCAGALCLSQVGCCITADSDARAPWCHLGHNGECSRESFAKSLFVCLFDHRHLWLFSLNNIWRVME